MKYIMIRIVSPRFNPKTTKGKEFIFPDIFVNVALLTLHG